MEIAVGSQPGLWQRSGAEAHVAEVIAPGVVLLAVADGFGNVRGTPVATVTVTTVRDALKRKVRSDTRDPRSHLMPRFRPPTPACSHKPAAPMISSPAEPR